MKEFVLKAAQGGFAAGEAFLLKPKKDGAQPAPRQKTGDESARLDRAVAELRQELSAAAAKAKGENAEIYEAEGLLLDDKDFTGAARVMIEKDGLDAPAAVTRAADQIAAGLSGSGSDYIRRRTDDIKGLADRLLRILDGETQEAVSKPAILVAEELSPAELSCLDGSMLLGIVTAKGAPTSHVAILAGSLGIPYLYGSEEAVEAVREGDRLILDGEKLTVNPDDAAYAAAEEKARDSRQKTDEAATAPADVQCRTKIFANIKGPEDVEALLASGAEGVGLFRSEFLFLDRASAPTEDEQFEAYRKVAEAMAGKEVVIRTMDIGSDKNPEWLKLPEEKNPALGCRGLRASLCNEDLFRTQLRALLRAASAGNVSIMLPMIISLWEVDTVRQLMDKYAKELEAEKLPYKIPPLGVMIETPAAAMIADDLAEHVAFFSIGTNDLTQYTLALDREAQGLERYYTPLHEAVYRLIQTTAKAAHKKGIPTAVCGELAGNPAAIERLIEAGVDELSVAVNKVQETRCLAAEAEKRLSEERAGADTIAAPADGELVPMKEIPDPAFSTGTLGECVGILPDNGAVYAPCSGTIVEIADTKHALTLSDPDGRKLLIHLGINTVSLNGRPFTVYGKVGDSVKQGQKLADADLDMIRAAGLSPMVIVVRCS